MGYFICKVYRYVALLYVYQAKNILPNIARSKRYSYTLLRIKKPPILCIWLVSRRSEQSGVWGPAPKRSVTSFKRFLLAVAQKLLVISCLMHFLRSTAVRHPTTAQVHQVLDCSYEKTVWLKRRRNFPISFTAQFVDFQQISSFLESLEFYILQ